MSSTGAYLVLVLVVAMVRLVELRTSRRNLLWATANGGVETGAGHYSWMVALHMAFLVGCVVEVFALDRPFVDLLGWPMLVLLVAAHGLRWWCITTLGPQWNTRVVRVPGQAVVTGGPYRWLRHPNYVAVALEGIALPLVHSAWITAVVFTVLNVVLMRVRLGVENAALAQSTERPPVEA